MHGLAGTAAVALALLANAPTVGSGVAYLACFSIGTIAGMILLTGVLGVGFALAAFQQRVTHALRISASLA